MSQKRAKEYLEWFDLVRPAEFKTGESFQRVISRRSSLFQQLSMTLILLCLMNLFPGWIQSIHNLLKDIILEKKKDGKVIYFFYTPDGFC